MNFVNAVDANNHIANDLKILQKINQKDPKTVLLYKVENGKIVDVLPVAKSKLGFHWLRVAQNLFNGWKLRDKNPRNLFKESLIKDLEGSISVWRREEFLNEDLRQLIDQINQSPFKEKLTENIQHLNENTDYLGKYSDDRELIERAVDFKKVEEGKFEDAVNVCKKLLDEMSQFDKETHKKKHEELNHVLVARRLAEKGSCNCENVFKDLVAKYRLQIGNFLFDQGIGRKEFYEPLKKIFDPSEVDKFTYILDRASGFEEKGIEDKLYSINTMRYHFENLSKESKEMFQDKINETMKRLEDSAFNEVEELTESVSENVNTLIDIHHIEIRGEFKERIDTLKIGDQLEEHRVALANRFAAQKDDDLKKLGEKNQKLKNEYQELAKKLEAVDAEVQKREATREDIQAMNITTPDRGVSSEQRSVIEMVRMEVQSKQNPGSLSDEEREKFRAHRDSLGIKDVNLGSVLTNEEMRKKIEEVITKIPDIRSKLAAEASELEEQIRETVTMKNAKELIEKIPKDIEELTDDDAFEILQGLQITTEPYISIDGDFKQALINIKRECDWLTEAQGRKSSQPTYYNLGYSEVTKKIREQNQKFGLSPSGIPKQGELMDKLNRMKNPKLKQELAGYMQFLIGLEIEPKIIEDLQKLEEKTKVEEEIQIQNQTLQRKIEETKRPLVQLKEVYDLLDQAMQWGGDRKVEWAKNVEASSLKGELDAKSKELKEVKNTIAEINRDKNEFSSMPLDQLLALERRLEKSSTS